MTRCLNLQIDRSAPAFVTAAAAPAALGLVAIAARFVATLGFGGGVDSSLRNRDSRLGLYLRGRFGHNILGLGVRRQGQRQGGNLHKKGSYAKAVILLEILPEWNEKTFKHLVANPGLKHPSSKRFSESVACRIVP